MAIGDAAAAAGLPVYASTQDRRLGYQNDNQRGDDIANHMTSTNAHDIANITGTQTVAKGGTGATTAAAARTNLGITYPNIGTAPVVNGGTGATTAAAARTNLGVSPIADVTDAKGTAVQARGGDMDIAVWVRDVGSFTRLAVWMGNTGQILLGYASSLRKHKQNIEAAAPYLTREQLRGITVSMYRYKVAVAREEAGGEPAQHEIGLIADDLHALGLWQFVAYEGRGKKAKPKTIHYELLGLAALQLAQYTADDIDALTARVEALEKKLEGEA